MKRFREIVKEVNPDELLLLFHINLRPTKESVSEFLGAYYAVLRSRMKLSNTVLFKIEHNESKGDRFYGMDINNLVKELPFDDEEEEFELSKKHELDVSNIPELAALYIPDSFTNNFSNNFVVYIILNALYKSGQVRPYKIGEDCWLRFKYLFEKGRDAFSYRLLSEYVHLNHVNTNEVFLNYVLDDCIQFKESGYCTKRIPDEVTYEVDWAELLSYRYHFYDISAEVFSENVANPRDLYVLYDKLSEAVNSSQLNYLFQKEDFSNYIIRLRDSSLPGGFPEVHVIDPDGNICELSDYGNRQIVKMKIEIESKLMDYESIIAILLMYIRYPKRMQRRNKRDQISKLLNIWLAYSDVKSCKNQSEY